MTDALLEGRPIFAELSPVTDFREACCRQNDLGLFPFPIECITD
jgi:hypothetical protein